MNRSSSMAKGNGKSDTQVGLKQEDLERELPAGIEDESAASSMGAGAASEAEKLKAERDALLDRLARLQAEFDNARKRSAREQQEFREFAAADVIKNFLPTLDSFERALKANADPTDFRNGVDLIYRQFQDAL